MGKIIAVKASRERAAKLSALECRYRASKSLILRHTAAAITESVPQGKVCRFDLAELGNGEVTVSANLWESTLADLDSERFPSENAKTLMQFSVIIATSVLARQELLCLPVGLILVWPADGTLRPKCFEASKPRYDFARGHWGKEAYDRGRPWSTPLCSGGFPRKPTKNAE